MKKGVVIEMGRRKKFILVALLAAVVLVGSIGGVVLAQTENGDEGGPRAGFKAMLDKVCELYNANPERPGDIDRDILEAAFNDARSAMLAERPQGMPPNGPMEQVLENLGITDEAMKAAFEQARTELKDGTLEDGPKAVMARVLEILGISEEDWQAACDEARSAMQAEFPDGIRPDGPGFGPKGHGMGGPCGWGKYSTPEE